MLIVTKLASIREVNLSSKERPSIVLTNEFTENYKNCCFLFDNYFAV